MAKRIHHMGMTMARTTHDKFHRRAPDLTAAQHNALMKRMGITKEQDEAWHRAHLTLGEQRTLGLTHVDPSAITAGFLHWCIEQKWLIRRDQQYFASKDGIRELSTRFDITIKRTPRR